MKRLAKMFFAAAALMLMTGMLSGCIGVSVEELYYLPEQADDYKALQERIDEVIASGAEYSAPVSGEYRQSVQLHDISGNGTDEAIAFFNISGDKPLKIYVFRFFEGKYETAAVIEGDGTSIGSISYTDFNNDGWKEITVGWQMSGGVQMVGVYSLRDFSVTTEILTDYTNYVAFDMDSDGAEDLTVIRYDRASMYGSAETYYFRPETGVESSVARLSATLESLDRVRTTKLTDGNAAIVIEGACDGGNLLTDILAGSKDGELTNISLDTSTGISEETVRSYKIYSSDINSDGCLDIPMPVQLPAYGDNPAYRAVDWYGYSAGGRREKKLSTYHNYTDGWYLILPNEWRDNFTVRRDAVVSGERKVTFSIWNGEDEALEDFLVISALTGANRHSRAGLYGRFTLLEEGDTIYVARILLDKNSWIYAIDNEQLIRSFGLIYSDWVTGIT